MKHTAEHKSSKRPIKQAVLAAIGVGAVAGATFLGGVHKADKPSTPTTTQQGDGCESPKDFHKMAGLGDMVCEIQTGPNKGLLEVRLEDGSTFLTHGGDPSPTRVEPTPHP